MFILSKYRIVKEQQKSNKTESAFFFFLVRILYRKLGTIPSHKCRDIDIKHTKQGMYQRHLVEDVAPKFHHTSSYAN